MKDQYIKKCQQKGLNLMCKTDTKREIEKLNIQK